MKQEIIDNLLVVAPDKYMMIGYGTFQEIIYCLVQSHLYLRAAQLITVSMVHNRSVRHEVFIQTLTATLHHSNVFLLLHNAMHGHAAIALEMSVKIISGSHVGADGTV